MKSYIVEIYNQDTANQEFNRIAEITTFKSLNFIEVENNVGICSFNLNINDEIATEINLRRYINVVVIKEYDSDIPSSLGTIVWSGHITHVSGGYEGITGRVDVEAATPLNALMSRYTDYNDVVYTATEQASILWDLIDTTQSKTNGFMGIYQGSLATGNVRDRTYQRNKIGELLVNMSNVIDGCGFSFDPIQDTNGKFVGWTFNTAYPKAGALRTDLNAIEIGQNVQSLSFNTRGDIYNTVIGIGGGTGYPIYSEQSSSGSQLGSTRRETFYTNKDVLEQTTLDEQSEGYLNIVQAENFDISLSLIPKTNPEYGSFFVGDYLYLNLQKGYLNIQGWRKVKAIDIKVSDNGVAYCTPILTN